VRLFPLRLYESSISATQDAVMRDVATSMSLRLHLISGDLWYVWCRVPWALRAGRELNIEALVRRRLIRARMANYTQVTCC